MSPWMLFAYFVATAAGMIVITIAAIFCKCAWLWFINKLAKSKRGDR